MKNTTRIKLQNRLNDIVKELSDRDFRYTNKKQSNGLFKRPFKPYSLSCDTLEALKLYNITCKASEKITPEEENEVKAYLMIDKFKTKDIFKEA